MRFAFAHKLVAYMFAGLGLIALMLGSTFTLVDSMVVMFAFIASWFAEPPAIDSPGYSRFWNIAAVVLLLVQIARAIGGEAVLTVGVQYAAFLQISRLAHRKTAADYQQIAILAFLHLIAGTVLSSGLDFGVVFFGFVIVMPWMLTLTHLRKELETQHGVNRIQPDRVDVVGDRLLQPSLGQTKPGEQRQLRRAMDPVLNRSPVVFFGFPRLLQQILNILFDYLMTRRFFLNHPAESDNGRN